MDKMKTDAGSLLTSSWFSYWTYSAIARMSVGAAVANGTANVPSKPMSCGDDVDEKNESKNACKASQRSFL